MLVTFHMRAPRKDFDARPGRHKGVVTVVARIIGHEQKFIEIKGERWGLAQKRIVMGLSFCSPKDQFSKRKGRGIALDRMNNDPLIIPYLHNAFISLNGMVLAVVSGDLTTVTNFAHRCPSWATKALHWGPRWAGHYGFKVIDGDAMRILSQSSRKMSPAYKAAMIREVEDAISKITPEGAAGLTRDFIELARKMSPEYKAAMIREVEDAISKVFQQRQACPERNITVLGRRPCWDPRGNPA